MTEPLIVDPSLLASASTALVAAAADIPVMPAPLSVPGSDPLSVAIAAGAVAVEAPMAALPEIKTAATTTATNVGVAAQRYTSTDQALAAKAASHQFAPPASAGSAAAGAASAAGAPASAAGAPAAAGSAAAAGGIGVGGMGSAGNAGSQMGQQLAQQGSQMGQQLAQQGSQMGQQLAQQAGQIPSQLAGAAGQGPQSVMQGAQGAVQQISQMAGQFGKAGGDDGKAPGEVPGDRRESAPEDDS